MSVCPYQNHAAIFLNAQIEKKMQTILQNLEHFRLMFMNELSHIKVYLQYTLVEYSINAHNSPPSEATGGDLLAFLVSLSDIH